MGNRDPAKWVWGVLLIVCLILLPGFVAAFDYCGDDCVPSPPATATHAWPTVTSTATATAVPATHQPQPARAEKAAAPTATPYPTPTAPMPWLDAYPVATTTPAGGYP